MRRLSLLRPVARVVLGLFVLGQVAFLVAANFAALPELPRGAVASLPSALREPVERLQADGLISRAQAAAGAMTQPWAEGTGQWQSWGLFAPDVTDWVPFPTLELRWKDRPPQRLPALNAPADRRHFFRLGNFRLRRLESALEVSPDPGRPFEPSGAAWRAALERQVAAKEGCMIAYLGWRLAAFERVQPDLPPPAEVILSMHLYRIPSPPGPEPWDWDDLGLQPVARWRPESAVVPEMASGGHQVPVCRREQGADAPRSPVSGTGACGRCRR